MGNTNFKGTNGNIRLVSDFNITNGTERICELSEYTNQEYSKEKRNENGKLIIDAFNVRQQINFDLPQLLKQRNEMLELLEKVVNKLKGNGFPSLQSEIETLIKEAREV